MLGTRGTETGKRLYEELSKHNPEALYLTDYWQAYREFIPESQHYQSKAQTYTVEGYNSIMRHFLARLRRKSKCYSKSVTMLKYSLLLLFAKRNQQLSILI